MCGIVGIYLKSKKFEGSLGNMLSDMLINMGSRGPDSAGFAIYKEDEEEKINDITGNIVKQLPTLIEKKIDLFSSKVNQDLNGI